MIQDQIYRYFERNESKRVLFIFDKMDDIKTELQDASWKEGFRYVVFDGSWFSTKYHLHHSWREEKVILLFPAESQIVYPDNESTRLAFPLLGELEAGGVLHSENERNFLVEHQIDEQYRAYVKENINDLSIGRVATILRPYYEARNFSPEIAQRAILSHMMDSTNLLGWNEIILRLLLLGLKSEEKKCITFFNRLSKRPHLEKLVQEQLINLFGTSYNSLSSVTRVEELVRIWKYNLICRNVESGPNDDYKSLKRKSQLSVAQMVELYNLAQLDKKNAEKYELLMTELGAEVQVEKILDCYGLDAPYSYIPEEMCISIIKKTIDAGIKHHHESVFERMESLLMRQPGNQLMANLTGFVSSVARYYTLSSKINTKLNVSSAQELFYQYAESIYELDTLYRKTIECFYSLRSQGLPIELVDSLAAAKFKIDADYHELTGLVNLKWTNLIQAENKGWDFGAELTHQADFYKTYVQKVGTRLMVIVSDALRYEVAQEMLTEILKRSKRRHEMCLKSMLGTLPSETQYAKLSLLPHQTMSFIPEGTSLDGKPFLANISQREAHLSMYREKSKCFNFEELQNDSQTNREQLKGHKLVYVFHDVIDSIGHQDDGESLVGACRKTINELSEFIISSLVTYNFEKVILTSDHGFLFNDIQFKDNDKQSIIEESTEKKSRYYLTSSKDKITNVVKYDGVAVPMSTNRFSVPGGTYKFVHGGASLQEVVVPVLIATRGRELISEQKKVQLMLLSTPLVVESSLLQFSFIQKDAVSYDLKSLRIRFALYQGEQQVSEERELDINSTDSRPSSRIYNQCLILKSGTTGALLELRVYDVDDALNPIIKEIVTNKTLVERDF